MPQHLNLLFVLADAEHVRFVRPAGDDNTLRASSRVLPGEGHPGEAGHPHAQHHEKFAGWIADQLNQHATSFDELVLAAPPHTLSIIRTHLAQPVQTKIIGSLDKDLTKIAAHDLWPHLKEFVRPVHRQKLL